MDVRLLLFMFGAVSLCKLIDYKSSTTTFNRSSFPENFVFGTASSSYQYEGAYNQDGRTPSIWDTFTHKHPEKIADHGNGDVANDQYHRYKEDVALMKNIGMDAYRFSISWSRVLPNGKLSGGVNRKGIQYYNNLIDELLSKGLEPFVTIFHWDVPQHLEDEYGGFLSSDIVSDFQDYAELCYKEFGDRVKRWMTLNEPRTFSFESYNNGRYAPGRCSAPVGNCSYGNSATEPYITGHNQLLAHAAAVKIYREKYQADQKGEIGIVLNTRWFLPFSQNKLDEDAIERVIDFYWGWYMHPLTYGDYPDTMRSIVATRLPKFSKCEADRVKGSFDFIGINYYTANYAENVPFSDHIMPSYSTDPHAKLTPLRNGIPIGPPTGLPWLFIYPSGLREVLLYTKRTYGNIPIYITENGSAEANNSTLSLDESLIDNSRIEYYQGHLKFLLRAIKDGVDVRGYFAWSMLDNMEWADGYTARFGLNYVDWKTLKRYPKHSALWFKKFLLNS